MEGHRVIVRPAEVMSKLRLPNSKAIVFRKTARAKSGPFLWTCREVKVEKLRLLFFLSDLLPCSKRSRLNISKCSAGQSKQNCSQTKNRLFVKRRSDEQKACNFDTGIIPGAGSIKGR